MKTDPQIFQDMDAPTLRSYIDFFLRHYRVMDAFWFIYLSERFGQEAAEQINEKVWGRVGGLAAGPGRRFGIRTGASAALLRCCDTIPEPAFWI
jgi:hypothetical protein